MPKPLGPKIRVPPLFFGVGFLAGLWLESIRRIEIATPAPRWLGAAGWTVALLGLAFSLSGIATFGAAGTTMFPFEPARRLVMGGPYRFTRNPMYVGGVISYIGVAVAMNVAWPLLLLPLVILTLYWFVIRAEERYLLEMFGDAYAEYRARVRRWL